MRVTRNSGRGRGTKVEGEAVGQGATSSAPGYDVGPVQGGLTSPAAVAYGPLVTLAAPNARANKGEAAVTAAKGLVPRTDAVAFTTGQASGAAARSSAVVVASVASVS